MPVLEPVTTAIAIGSPLLGKSNASLTRPRDNRDAYFYVQRKLSVKQFLACLRGHLQGSRMMRALVLTHSNGGRCAYVVERMATCSRSRDRSVVRRSVFLEISAVLGAWFATRHSACVFSAPPCIPRGVAPYAGHGW